MARGGKPLTYHLFDIGGMYLGTFVGAQKVADKIGGCASAVLGAYTRQGCLYGKYYVSKDRNFKIDSVSMKANFNPIFSKRLGHQPKFVMDDHIKIYKEVEDFFRCKEDVDYLCDNYF